MITRVLDAKGNALHDCAEAGCTVSWDGYMIRGGTRVQTGVALDGVTAVMATLATGDEAPGRTDPDPALWTVVGNRAQRKNGS